MPLAAKALDYTCTLQAGQIGRKQRTSSFTLPFAVLVLLSVPLLAFVAVVAGEMPLVALSSP